MVVVPAEDDIKLGRLGREALVVGHAHVRQGHHHVAALLAAQLRRQPAARHHKVGVLHRVLRHERERGNPLALRQAHEAHLDAALLQDVRRRRARQWLSTGLVDDVGQQPRERAVAHVLRQRLDAEVQIMVPDDGNIYSNCVEHRHHVLATREDARQARVKGVAAERN